VSPEPPATAARNLLAKALTVLAMGLEILLEYLGGAGSLSPKAMNPKEGTGWEGFSPKKGRIP